MTKKNFQLIGVILLAVLFFSAEAALSKSHDDDPVIDFDPSICFFSNPYPTLQSGFTSISIDSLKKGIDVKRGGKFFLGIYAPHYEKKVGCSFYMDLVEINGTNASLNDVKITDIKGNELKYTTDTWWRRPYYKHISLPYISAFNNSDVPEENKNYIQVFIDMTNAKPDATYKFNVGYYLLEGMSLKGWLVDGLTFRCAFSKEELPSIDAPQTITIEQGGIGEAMFTGKSITSWYYKEDDFKEKGVESVTLEPRDAANACRATVKLSTSAVENTQINIPIYALNKYGDETSSTLTVNVQPDEDHKAPIIDGNKSIEIIAGGTGTATFTGQHVKNWSVTNLPSFVESVATRDSGSHPNFVEFLVKVKDEVASVGQTGDVKIHAYNGAGKDVATPATLTVTVTAGEKYATPTIDEDEYVTVIQGGTAAATFTGQHTRRWEISPLTQQDWEAFKVDFDYSQNPARCQAKVTAYEDAEDGTYSANVYAYNAAGQISEPKTLTIKIEKNAAHKTAVIDSDESVSVTYGGAATAVFTGSHVRTWAADEVLPSWINGVDFDYSKNPDSARVTVTASSNAAVKAGETAKINIYAYNGVGQRSEPKTLTVTLVNDEAHEDPKIDEDESLTVVQGGTSKAVFTGQHIRSWGYATLPDAVKSVVMNYEANPNRCEVLVTASSTAEVGDCEVTIYAYNAVGERTSAKLKVAVTEDTSHPDPVIDENESVTVVQGGTAQTIFTGEHIRSWSYGNLPDSVKAVELRYDVNPNRCEVLVTASSNAEVGDTSVTIFAYNDIGEATSADLTVTIIEDTSHPDPVIYEDESVTVIAGGTAKAVFTGEHVRAWAYFNLPDEVKAINLDYEKHPNRCEVLVTASSNAKASDTPVTVYIYAFNEIGESTSATLNVTITEDTSHPDPVIDEDESVTVIAGGTAKAVFTGEHIRSWAYGNLPDSVKALELNYSLNPDRCEALVTASSNAEAGSATVTIYAYNEIGESTSKTLNVTIVADGSTHDDPVIDEDESVTIVAGGTAKAVFTGQHIRSWSYGNLPDSVKALELNYSLNPDRCEALVTASSNAEAGSATVTIYAYNEIGESTSKTLNVTIVVDGSTHDDPVIDEDESVTIVAGGTAKAVFTGQHIRSWAYGNLPDSVKAVELNYSVNPDRCEVTVTAGSNAAAGSDTITIYAYNEIGESTSKTLTVTIVESSSHPAPSIDAEGSVSVVPGGTSSTLLTGQNVASWAYKDLPSEIKAIELRYTSNPNRCEVLVMASSTAEIGTDCSVTIYAYNSVGVSTESTLNVSVIDGSDDAETPEFTTRPKSADVVPGGSAVSVFKARNVKYWRHDGNLPSIVKAVEFRYNPENPDECEVIVTASSTAKVGDTATIKIFAGNVYDEAEAEITVTIASESVAAPVINEKTASITVAPGKSAKTTFTGTNISSWKHGNLPDGVDAIEFVYDTNNPNNCEVVITANALASSDEGGDIAITAYNSVGVSAEATLTVTISKDADSGDDDTDFPSFLRRHSSGGCDMGFAGMSLLALSMMLFKSKSKK